MISVFALLIQQLKSKHFTDDFSITFAILKCFLSHWILVQFNHSLLFSTHSDHVSHLHSELVAKNKLSPKQCGNHIQNRSTTTQLITYLHKKKNVTLEITQRISRSCPVTCLGDVHPAQLGNPPSRCHDQKPSTKIKILYTPLSVPPTPPKEKLIMLCITCKYYVSYLSSYLWGLQLLRIR